jgi:hypothetical protein
MEDEQEEVQEQVTVKQVSMKWGLYLGMVMIIYGMVLLLTDMVGNQALGYVNYVFVAVFMYMAHKSFKEEGNGYMSYGQGLGIGTLLTVVGSAMSTVFSFLYVSFVDDSLLEKMKEMTEQSFVDQGMTDAQIEQAMSISDKFMTPAVMFPIAFVFTVFFGFIISLIVSAITKNPDPSAEI